MAAMVERDERMAKMRWAVEEAKHLKEKGEAVPVYISDLVQENQKGADRWAACKAAEMKAANEDVPEWMAESARRGIMDAANEKIQELQEEIKELESHEEDETEKVKAEGDTELAQQMKLARTKASSRVTVEQQGAVVQIALEALKGLTSDKEPQSKKALAEARDSAKWLTKVLDMRIAAA